MVSFIHDHVFLKCNDQLYTSGSLDSEVMERYINIFGSIRLITRCKEVNSLKDGLEPSSIENTEFVCVPDYKSFMKILNYFEARKIIKEEVLKAEYIILRTSSFANIAARYARKYNKAYLVEVVACSWDVYWNHSLKGKLIAPLMYFITKKNIKSAKYALYVSKGFLQSRYPCYGETISCSDVIIQPLSKDTLEKRLNKIKQMTDDKPIVLGTIAAVNIRYKGQQYVIKAIAKLNKRGYNFEYHLVGGGDQSYLKAVAQKYKVLDKVKLLGSLPHDKVFDFIKNIDIYVQPSNAESHGRVIVEAMSLACPIIGSSTGGIPELVASEFVFKRKNVNDLNAKIKKMNKEAMIKEAKRSFEKAKEFNKELLDDKRNNFYKSFKKIVSN